MEIEIETWIVLWIRVGTKDFIKQTEPTSYTNRFY